MQMRDDLGITTKLENGKAYLNHPEMKRVVELKERNFADKDKYEDAPVDFDDAIENYKRVLDITGDIAANIIEPNAEEVDLEGPHPGLKTPQQKTLRLMTQFTELLKTEHSVLLSEYLPSL